MGGVSASYEEGAVKVSDSSRKKKLLGILTYTQTLSTSFYISISISQWARRPLQRQSS